MRTIPYKKYFTKPERILIRLLQENRIQFKTKVKIQNREIDFVIGNLAIEVNGHEQNSDKNKELLSVGLIPLNFSNIDLLNNKQKVVQLIKERLK